ncbi:MAG: hypothetical protein WAR78_17265 [Ferruginibacter sp.]
MKKWISRTGIFYVAGLTLLFVITGCSKSAVETVQTTYLQQQFEDNILNKNFRVHLATDNGVDLTPQYTGYTFVLYKSTYYNGPMTAVKNGITYNGTWSSNDDYSKLVITFPSTPAEFVFLNREWKFTKKSLPIMELATWGTLEPKVLHMERF